MIFDATKLRLTHKIAILTLGVALFVAVAIGTMGDWMLRSIATDLAQGRSPTSVATLERLTSEGRPVMASRIITPDGREGILFVQMPLELAPTPASLTSETSPAGGTFVALQSDESVIPIGPMRKNLLLTCLAVLAAGTLLGFLAAKAFTEPLARVVGDLGRLAKGDTNVDLSDSWRTDEIGDISRAAVVFRNNITELRTARRKSGIRSETPSVGFASAMREQWEAAKRLFSSEWNSLAHPVRSATVSAPYRSGSASYASGSAESPAWTAWVNFLNGDWGRRYRAA